MSLLTGRRRGGGEEGAQAKSPPTRARGSSPCGTLQRTTPCTTSPSRPHATPLFPPPLLPPPARDSSPAAAVEAGGARPPTTSTHTAAASTAPSAQPPWPEPGPQHPPTERARARSWGRVTSAGEWQPPVGGGGQNGRLDPGIRGRARLGAGPGEEGRCPETPENLNPHAIRRHADSAA